MKATILLFTGLLASVASSLQPLSLAAEPTHYTASIYAGTPGTEDDPNGGRGSDDGSRLYARFYEPDGLALDGDGNLYVTDGGNHTIRKITPAGLVTTLAGLAGEGWTTPPPLSDEANGVGESARFRRPRDIVMHPDGNLWVLDDQALLRKVTLQGAVTTSMEMSARLELGTRRIAFDGEGRLYGTWVWAGDGYFRGPARSRFVPPGYSDGPFSEAEFYRPAGMGVSPEGDIFVADLGNRIIRKISSVLTVSTIAGQPLEQGTNDGSLNEALFNAPLDVAVDAEGNAFVMDDRAVRKIGTDGRVTTILPPGLRKTTVFEGTTLAVPRSFGAIAVHSDGRVFVSDPVSNVILMLVPADTLPPIQVTAEGSNLILSWPASEDDLVLESTSDLTTPHSWRPASESPLESGGIVMVTTEITGEARFWRLRWSN